MQSDLTFYKKNADELKPYYWRGAVQASQRILTKTCNCDLCHQSINANSIKIFHTIDGSLRFSRYLCNQLYQLVDHIFICKECIGILGEKWVSCNCSMEKFQNLQKGESICQISQ